MLRSFCMIYVVKQVFSYSSKSIVYQIICFTRSAFAEPLKCFNRTRECNCHQKILTAFLSKRLVWTAALMEVAVVRGAYFIAANTTRSFSLKL